LLTPLTVSVGGAGEPPRLLELGAGTLLAQNLAVDESLLDTMSAGLAVAGVLDYAAPEYLADPTRPTPATDQYGLGAVAYFALTSHSPYPDGSLTGRLLAQRTGAAVPVAVANPEIPPALAAVVDRMLSPRPEDRFTGLDEVRDALAAFAGDDPAFAIEEPEPPRASPEASFGGLDVGSHGSVSWGSGRHQLPERDNSDASVGFDLPPPAPQDAESFAPHDEGPATELTDTPRSPSERHPDFPDGQTPRLLAAITPSGPSPVPPDSTPTPAPAESTHMAKSWSRESKGEGKPERVADPRASLPSVVQWHTEVEGPIAQEVGNDAPPSGSGMWKSLKRMMFWAAPTDVVQVSVFGPPAVSPGQTARVTVYLHTPDAVNSVRTLSRAFQHDAELIGRGYVARQVSRQTQLGVHLFTSNAAAAKSLHTFSWRGTPHRISFDVHVPWESPSGPAPGLVSVGRDDIRIGKIAFNLHILPRKG
jgi:hypothetical protein